METSNSVIDAIAQSSPTVMLSFSCGKDSIAAWLAIRGRFEKIVPFYMYLIPDLEFVEESLLYYERFFDSRISRYPSPSLYRMLNNCVFQPPERIRVVDEVGLPDFDRDDVQQVCAEDNALPASCFTAIGNRISDNLVRRMAYRRSGAINHTRKTFWPIFDWTNDDLRKSFRASGVKLPIDYSMFGRSFDGLNIRYLWPIKQKFPRDYARILELFPLADLEVYRYEHQR